METERQLVAERAKAETEVPLALTFPGWEILRAFVGGWFRACGFSRCMGP